MHNRLDFLKMHFPPRLGDAIPADSLNKAQWVSQTPSSCLLDPPSRRVKQGPHGPRTWKMCEKKLTPPRAPKWHLYLSQSSPHPQLSYVNLCNTSDMRDTTWGLTFHPIFETRTRFELLHWARASNRMYHHHIHILDKNWTLQKAFSW